jgi:hypothetical protein
MRRWILIHISTGITGAWAGVFTLLGLHSVASRIFTFKTCSGIPCSSEEYYSLLISAVAGGALGAVIGYRLRQLLLGQSVHFRVGLLYTLVGALSWPIVGLVWVILMWNMPPLFRGYSPGLVRMNSLVGSILVLTFLGGIVGALAAIAGKRHLANQTVSIQEANPGC